MTGALQSFARIFRRDSLTPCCTIAGVRFKCFIVETETCFPITLISIKNINRLVLFLTPVISCIFYILDMCKQLNIPTLCNAYLRGADSRNLSYWIAPLPARFTVLHWSVTQLVLSLLESSPEVGRGGVGGCTVCVVICRQYLELYRYLSNNLR